MAAAFDRGLKLALLLGLGPERHQPVESGVEPALIGFQRAVLEPVASLAEDAGVFQQPLEAGDEDPVSGVDGALGVADETGETEPLIFRRPADLGGAAVRQPPGNSPTPSFPRDGFNLNTALSP
jgi:hypothetical protein